MSSRATPRVPDPRFQVELNPALFPPYPRYRAKTIEELREMEPLDELPEILIPGRVPRVVRVPPLLRKGYPITHPTLCRLMEEERLRPVPMGDIGRYVSASMEVERLLQMRLGWPVKCYLVYGLLWGDQEGLIACMPVDVQEKLKRKLGVEGPAKWYLDSEVSQWDWKVVYGMR
ncbi:hypothetical protein BD779DRAFT_1574542 [Infundibulicybe gibba]|nr:hypothetical protein BD779DRAFT_1574542 [Infundibulicybe gibba]